ncbi:MAG: arginine--tRNA ligase [Bacilli bacterium]
MDVILNLKQLVIDSFLKKYGLQLTFTDVVIENSRSPEHGDYATNVAMKYAKALSLKPIELANSLKEEIKDESIAKIEIAGPGFINFFMSKDSLNNLIKNIILKGDDYGRGEKKETKINIEFVSANPTGSLHVGHARGAAIGDSVARILSFDGYDVTREYYINDAGNQIDNLGLSLIERYKEIKGLPFSLPNDGYHGDDVKEIAESINKNYPNLLDLSFDEQLAFFKKEGSKIELDRIKEVLSNFGVTFDVFSSELEVRKDGAINKELEFLKPHTYLSDGALLLKTSDYLDDKDRVIVKSNGDYTYFLPDIVYHMNKKNRGFDLLIDVLGADHHGYINRMKSALMMHGCSEDTLEVELIQMVRIMKDGVEIKASKRSGNALTLQELIEEVGKDATRYFFAMRASSMHLDFDLNLAKEQSASNPVYYAQYAHARLSRVLELGKEFEIDIDNISGLTSPYEINLIKALNDFPKEVREAAKERAPYKMTNYIHRVSELVHSFYTECKIVDKDNVALSKSRLALSKASKIVLKNALNLIGVTALNKM